ncbi:MAG: Gfo/Idh/MocA family oxidoreductase [Phycisphaerae bacterium]|nr:Gfo/Idh/MocA family oxidoreductase [Phycisphaerae bacterium]
MADKARITRRGFMKKAAIAAAVPMFVNSRAFGANDRITTGCIGMGGRGTGDMGGFLGSSNVQVVAVCDVVKAHCDRAKGKVDGRYKSKDCKTYVDFREITGRGDIEAVMIGTPDHWHAAISIEAMKNGKDVFCEKPETLTVRQGRAMVKIARRYGRVFSGGSQRVWGDYNWFHRMVQGGAIGDVKEAWVNVWGPSGPCLLPPVATPAGVDWDMWLGPAPKRPFHPQLIRGGFRPFRDYSGGGMTDWGCHTFGGAMFCLGLHMTGPTSITPPDGKDVKYLTFEFANGVKIYHREGGDRMAYKGTEGEIPGPRGTRKQTPPNIHIPNYKGRGGLIGDFLHCVRTREKPFRDIEPAHRAATLCHLGNIAYWLKRPLKWDPVKEEIIGDKEAARWLDREAREPWGLW